MCTCTCLLVLRFKPPSLFSSFSFFLHSLIASHLLLHHSTSGYLKLYQLSPTDFAKEERWDVLLIDEAQDLTPAIIDLVTQTSCAKIFVGDPHQQIYSFRGATNAMPLVRADHTCYLTRVSTEK